MRRFHKIHIIALPRCATVSICDALQMLGIRLAHLGRIDRRPDEEHHDTARLVRMHQQITNGNLKLDILDECDGLADYPACITQVYQGLDELHPDSLFINIRRDLDSNAWLRSAERQFIGLRLLKSMPNSSEHDQEFVDTMNAFRELTFGSREFHAETYLRAYENHQRTISDYFSRKPASLLDIPDISLLNEHGFDLLCDFLDCKKPNFAFPYNNRHSIAPEQAYHSALARGEITAGIEDNFFDGSN